MGTPSSQPPQSKVDRSIVYIDGFNLYYGALKGTPHKWLNIERYFQLLLSSHNIQKIRYFTARVGGKAAGDQETYLQALATLPLVEIILGQFKTKQIEGRCPDCPLPKPRFFTSYEEKRTDVNIALWMFHDAQKDLCDRLILVSGDSDLVSAIAMVKDHCPNKVVSVYIPARNKVRGAAVELRSIADKHKTLPLNILPAAQFSAQITTGAGIVIKKPSSW
ncbi:MAG: NYN domain-containing protein [Pirellulales bacterium]